MSDRSFGARLAHCNVAWGRSPSKAIARCNMLLRDTTITSIQRERVLARRRLIETKHKTTKRPFYMLSYADLDVNLKIKRMNPEQCVRRATTEMHQKCVMQDKKIKALKNRCRTSFGKFKCPRCRTTVPHLTTAHVGKPMRAYLDDEIRGGTFEKDVMVCVSNAHISNNAEVAIVCAKCNDTLES